MPPCDVFNPIFVRDQLAAREASPNFVFGDRYFSKAIYLAVEGPNQRGVVLRKPGQKTYPASAIIPEKDYPEITHQPFAWADVLPVYLQRQRHYLAMYWDAVVANTIQYTSEFPARRSPVIEDIPAIVNQQRKRKNNHE